MLLIFALLKTINIIPGGPNIVWYFDTPPTLIIITKFYLPFIFTWEDVLFHQNHINDLLCIYDAFIFHYQHMISQSYKLFY